MLVMRFYCDRLRLTQRYRTTVAIRLIDKALKQII